MSVHQPYIDFFSRQFEKEYEVVRYKRSEDFIDQLQDPKLVAIFVECSQKVKDGPALLQTALRLKPTVIRIGLAPEANLGDAISAVNQGQVYKFFTGELSAELIRNTLTEGLKLRKHRLRLNKIIQELSQQAQPVDDQVQKILEDLDKPEEFLA